MNCFEITFDNEEVAKENVRYDTIYLYADQDGENNTIENALLYF